MIGSMGGLFRPLFPYLPWGRIKVKVVVCIAFHPRLPLISVGDLSANGKAKLGLSPVDSPWIEELRPKLRRNLDPLLEILNTLPSCVRLHSNEIQDQAFRHCIRALSRRLPTSFGKGAAGENHRAKVPPSCVKSYPAASGDIPLRVDNLAPSILWEGWRNYSGPTYPQRLPQCTAELRGCGSSANM